MSFSGDVKEELVKHVPSETHCRMAELAALLMFYAKVEEYPQKRILLSTDNSSALRKFFTLLDKTFNIRAGGLSETSKGVIELNKGNSGIDIIFDKIDINRPMSLISKECCKRAYLRGAFLASGFVNDPNKGYHFEFITDNSEYTKLLTYLLSQFNIVPKHSVRKKYDVVYIKEFEMVSDLLSIIGAHKSMMEFANTRIVKDVRNSVNRRNNCDMANISKAVNAAAKQIEDIQYIESTVGLSSLPDSLQEMADVRMEHPESSLTELGTYLNPPVGKSGVNHRMRKITEFAEDLRKEREKK